MWVEERAREWGTDIPLYISKVLGEFPEVADDTTITPRMIREAHERDLSGNAIGHANLAITSVYLRGIDNTEIVHAVHERPAPMIPGNGLRLAP